MAVFFYGLERARSALHNHNPIRKGVKIFSNVLFVGCDVNPKHYTVCVVNPEGKKIGYQTFSNTISGAQIMEPWLLT